MELFVIGFLGLCFVGLLACLWALVCNERTCKQRTAMIDLWCGPDHQQQVERYRRASYDQHFWALFLLRDANALYEEGDAS